jgi:uncharacterized membrane-anchored protein
MNHIEPSGKSSSIDQHNHELQGFVYGFFGILIFSLTLPETRIAVAEFDPVFVGLGRSIGAAILSLILVIITRQPIPPKRYLPNFYMGTSKNCLNNVL